MDEIILTQQEIIEKLINLLRITLELLSQHENTEEYERELEEVLQEKGFY